MNGVLRVAVLRALMLGDLLCATPALRALKRGLPRAEITLVGLPWARELAARLPGVDRFAELPGWPGLPERPAAEPDERRAFLDGMRGQRFDWVLQMHGAGPVVNPLVFAFAARHVAGFRRSGDAVPEAHAATFTTWPETGTEAERLLQLTDHLRLPRRGLALDFPLQHADRDAAARLLEGLGQRPLAVVHAGSQLPSRRWPAGRFAAVADTLADAGLAVLLTGTAPEAALVRAVAGAMRHPARELAGRTSLWTLGALVERARLVVCNDTGLSHVAAALGTPSVVVSSGGDALRWAPADGLRHRVPWQDLPCRPCAFAECPIGHPCALGVTVAEVQREALRALARGLRG